jgi:hypothetical protein
MSYSGQVKEGVVVFDGSARPPEGAKVEVVELPASKAEPPSWGEVFKGLVGTVEGLPEVMAENHDHYIHGAPKQ